MVSHSTGMQYSHVLVPLDGSERSTVALRTGHALASRLGATVHTVSVATGPDVLAQLRLDAAAALNTASTDQRIHTVVGDDPVVAIAALADELGECIVCMSTHAHDRFAGAVVESAARGLIQLQGRPVVMIGPLADRPLYMGEVWAEPLAGDRVVVCVDRDSSHHDVDDGSFPDESSALVGIAAYWAHLLGMSLTILAVAVPVISLAGINDTDALNDWLAGLATRGSAHDIDIDVHVEVDPVGTVEGIRSYLAAHPSGLLVVSTHARGGIDRLVHGATAAGITAASTIATLVVPLPPQGDHT